MVENQQDQAKSPHPKQLNSPLITLKAISAPADRDMWVCYVPQGLWTFD